jgi:hypothetical protein
MEKPSPKTSTWKSPLPEQRWRGFRRLHRGTEAFKTLDVFEAAQVAELDECLVEHEKKTLGRLLKRGKKIEIDVFIRSHGPNPIFDPQAEIDIPVGVAKADAVPLTEPASADANRAILNGDIVHVLFQAGEASRFGQGPFYRLKPLSIGEPLSDVLDIAPFFDRINRFGKELPPLVSQFLIDAELGPKQPVMIRAALRRAVQAEVNAGRIPVSSAAEAYTTALKKQKLLFFVTQKDDLGELHFSALRDKYAFFGFDPANVVTVEQQLVRGVSADEDGNLSLEKHPEAVDAAGHLYALMQAARAGDFTTYSESGRPLKSQDTDGLAYLAGRGGEILNIIRINDMDRHTTEIINAKALSYALRMFEKGYVNVIECVANPLGQKGGTGTTFGDPDVHVLTETHENSFPSLSRAFEAALKDYLAKTDGQHPAYNAMRQLARLSATRQALREYGGRIVFIPRQKEVNGETISYLGVDMPMGDLSLLFHPYKSRMFQFLGPHNRELQIHDMKIVENLPIALRTIERQVQDPHIVAAAREVLLGESVPFDKNSPEPFVYGAPTPEFE